MNIMLKCVVTLCRKTRLSLIELLFALVSVVITELRDISLSNPAPCSDDAGGMVTSHSERNFIYSPAYNTTCIITVPHSQQPLVPIETSLGATVNSATTGT